MNALALDTGMRKGELCGLRWTDVDLEAAKGRIVQQLTRPGPEPMFGPTKTGRARTVSLALETVELLRAHEKRQAEVKMANRTAYHDFGLVFAKQWTDVRRRGDTLGQPLQSNNLGQREFSKLIKAAAERRIKFPESPLRTDRSPISGSSSGFLRRRTALKTFPSARRCADWL
jgi:integrase